MSRKKRHEEHENHERWLVSYADFITLLFAFFVVMYAISSVNEGKYRVLSDSLISAFRGSNRALAPIQVGQLVRSPPVAHELAVTDARPIALTAPFAPRFKDRGDEGEEAAAGGGDTGPGEADAGEAELSGQEPGAPYADGDAIARRIRAALSALIDQDLIELRRLADSLEVEIKTSILFPSGSARLVDAAIPVLEQLAEIFRRFPNPVHVEGFTDNVPINTEVYPSNWELSAARAASVVHVCTKYGVRPERLVAVGYGEYRPTAGNETAEGRSKNRRVVMVIHTDEASREVTDLRRHAAAPAEVPQPTGAVPFPEGSESLPESQEPPAQGARDDGPARRSGTPRA
jgi:chemotaxis protein MotB